MLRLNKYVYMEVSGSKLEETTKNGWEYVESVAGGPWGPSYVVRRPFEMPEAMKLSEELLKTKEELENARKVNEDTLKMLELEKKSAKKPTKKSAKKA